MKNKNTRLDMRKLIQCNWVSASIFLFLLILIIVKSLNLPASDDEYMSIHYFAEGPWLNILTSETQFNDWIPNNHILNTLLMKCEILVFGRKDWAIRLHSIIAFIICFYYSYKILSLMVADKNRIGLYLLILFFNPFYLDFFCLARGYALSFAAWTALYYYLISYIQKSRTIDLWYMQLALFIGVYSNFSTIYLMMLLFVILSFIIYHKKNEIKAIDHFMIFLATSVIIGSIIAIPLIRTIFSKATFGGHNGIFHDTIVFYINHWIHANRAIERHKQITESIKLIDVLGLIIFVNWCILVMLASFSKKTQFQKYNLYINLFLIIGVAVICKILFYTANVPYPTERTSLLFSIPFYFSIVFSLEILIIKENRFKLLLYVIAIFLTWHFSKGFTLYHTIQWWKNGDAKYFVNYFEDIKYSNSRKLKVAIESWQFPSFAFYAETELKDKINLIWANQFDNTDTLDYVIIPKEIKDAVKGNFSVEKEFRQTYILKMQ